MTGHILVGNLYSIVVENYVSSTHFKLYENYVYLSFWIWTICAWTYSEYIGLCSLNNSVIKTHTNQLLLLLICQHLSSFFLLFCNTYQSFVGSSSHKSAAFFNLMDLELNNKEINKDYFLWNILLPHFMIFHNTRDKFSCLVIWYATRHVSEY